MGHLTRICQDAVSVAGAVQETCSSEMFGGQGTDFLGRVAFWSIRSSGLLRSQVQNLRTSRKLAEFLMLSSSKTEEVSQNSFVFKLADR